MDVIKNVEEFEIEERNLFGDSEKVLSTVKEGRIFNVFYVERNNSFYLHEQCDEYFELKLTVDMCKDLSDLFSKIAEKTKENEEE